MWDIWGYFVGFGSSLFIGGWLIFHPEFEPKRWLRYSEIAVSLSGAASLFIKLLETILF